jgi:hypothetical protein
VIIASSWFPSQNSSEGGAKQSSSERLATVPAAAQNSPLAAFPVSPPTSEPPVSTVKKRSKPSDNVVGGSSRSAATASIAEDGRSEERPVKRRKIGSAVGVEDKDSNSAAKGKQREIIDQSHPGPVIKVSELVANPSHMLSLSDQQREALRQAAEQKWLARHPSFKLENHGGIEEPRKRANVTHKGPSSDLQAPPTKVESGRNEASNRAHDNQLDSSGPTEATKQALAETGGLVVPVWRHMSDGRYLLIPVYYCSVQATTEAGEVEYLPLSRLLAKGLKSTPPRNLIAVIQEARGDQVIGSRGKLALVPSHSR